MSTPNGTFVWYELMTSDTAAAENFYRGVVGWQTADAGMGAPYTILSTPHGPVGGLMAVPEKAREMGARPGWLGYVAVDDVDAFAKRATQAGGAIHHGPDDIPGVGRFASVADPQGAAFVLFKGSSDQPPPSVSPGTPGHAGWHELLAADWQPMFAFYAGLFGWTKDTAVDMGAMGTYQLFAPAAGGPAIGGMMTRPPQVPASFWQYYFNVDNIDTAITRITAHGGQVIQGPMEVPGGSWIVNAIDPQGAMFALVAPPKTS